MKTSLPSNITDEIKAGITLVGDDFDNLMLRKWYEEEKEAFYEHDSDSGDKDPWYRYMRYVNKLLVFRRISAEIKVPGSILFIGAGNGVEANDFYMANPDWRLNFIEASDNFKSELLNRFPKSRVIEPCLSGDIRLENDSQDVVCAFCVLHHIANVSHVMREVYRILKPGGIFFIREPCSSMGDWRIARSATPNERGISKAYMKRIATETGYNTVEKPTPIVFEPINKIIKKTIGYSVIPLSLLYVIDRVVSWSVAFNDYYWRDTWYKKIGPSSYHYVLCKPGK